MFLPQGIFDVTGIWKKSENNNNKKENMSEKFTFISKGAKNLLSISKELAWLFFHLSFEKKEHVLYLHFYARQKTGNIFDKHSIRRLLFSHKPKK